MPWASFYTLFCLFLLCSSLLSLPSHITSLVCTLPPNPSNVQDPQVCTPVHCKVPVCLQFLDSPQTSVTDQVCFWLLSLLMLIGQDLWPHGFSLIFFIFSTEKINIFIAHILFMPATRFDLLMTFPYNFLVRSVSACSGSWCIWPGTLRGADALLLCILADSLDLRYFTQDMMNCSLTTSILWEGYLK